MAKVVPLQHGIEGGLVAGFLSIVLLNLGGCVGTQPKPSTPTVTTDQVHGHADKAFENLKEEEQHRTTDPAETSY